MEGFKALKIDFERVFDVYPLLFCIGRQVVAIEKEVALHNNEYRLILNKTIEEGIEALCGEYKISEAGKQKMWQEFKKYLRSVKPRIPYMQMVEQLRENKWKICLAQKVEEEYVKQILEQSHSK